ncbi:hypothetical protein GCWU000325_01857 [Alloprevotella tannerae ATCC 51259]|uniref:Uncharacterized protein n=1 Tax=Alloprevotella tannerae ATCC 51259 TaxID=626522 RepID=C9LI03_9BACT|nr:hypothetical protein GCWU000325_01857 [Alloprevotella tannerae ATCC 51259]
MDLPAFGRAFLAEQRWAISFEQSTEEQGRGWYFMGLSIKKHRGSCSFRALCLILLPRACILMGYHSLTIR